MGEQTGQVSFDEFAGKLSALPHVVETIVSLLGVADMVSCLRTCKSLRSLVRLACSDGSAAFQTQMRRKLVAHACDNENWESEVLSVRRPADLRGFRLCQGPSRCVRVGAALCFTAFDGDFRGGTRLVVRDARGTDGAHRQVESETRLAGRVTSGEVLAVNTAKGIVRCQLRPGAQGRGVGVHLAHQHAQTMRHFNADEIFTLSAAGPDSPEQLQLTLFNPDLTPIVGREPILIQKPKTYRETYKICQGNGQILVRKDFPSEKSLTAYRAIDHWKLWRSDWPAASPATKTYSAFTLAHGVCGFFYQSLSRLSLAAFDQRSGELLVDRECWLESPAGATQRAGCWDDRLKVSVSGGVLVAVCARDSREQRGHWGSAVLLRSSPPGDAASPPTVDVQFVDLTGSLRVLLREKEPRVAGDEHWGIRDYHNLGFVGDGQFAVGAVHLYNPAGGFSRMSPGERAEKWLFVLVAFTIDVESVFGLLEPCRSLAALRFPLVRNLSGDLRGPASSSSSSPSSSSSSSAAGGAFSSTERAFGPYFASSSPGQQDAPPELRGMFELAAPAGALTTWEISVKALDIAEL